VYASVMYKTIADCFVDANNRFTLYCGCVYRNTIVSTRRREFCIVCRDSPEIFEVFCREKFTALVIIIIMAE